MNMSKNDTSSFLTTDAYDDENADILKYANIAFIYKWIVFTFVCQLVIVFGIGTNIINIICFVKQGFNDPVNVTLLGMAVSDLGSMTTLFWTNLCCNPAFSAADLPFEPFEVQYLISGMPHATFTTITGWITALVTLERCLCVTFPLKIKQIITPRRVAAVVISVFIIIISGQVPVYVVNKLDLKYFPEKNKTLIGLVYQADRGHVEKTSYVINNCLLPFCAFMVIIVCTIILVIELQTKSKWREKSTTPALAGVVSKRNQKVTRMVVIISVIFISCFIPICIVFVFMSLNPTFHINGKYKDLMLMYVGVGILLESVNSSVNIFVYFHMSSKYREVFGKLFSTLKQ